MSSNIVNYSTTHNAKKLEDLTKHNPRPKHSDTANVFDLDPL